MTMLSAMPSIRATLLAIAAPSALLAGTGLADAQLPVNSCILLPVTPGGLAPDGSGTVLTSATNSGTKATMKVTVTGARPTVKIAAPVLGGPAASLSGTTTSIAFSSLTGAAQGYTAGASAYSPNALTDIVTFDARAVNPAGFRAGSYSVSLTITCEF